MDMVSSGFGALGISNSFEHFVTAFAFTIVVLSFPFLLTYIFTYTRFIFQTWSPRSSGAHKSPIPPYLVPGIGHAYAILFDAENFLRPLQAKKQGSIIPLVVPVRSLCYVLPGKGVRSLFRAPRDLVPVPGIFDALTVFFGLTPVDYHVFNHDHISAFEAGKGRGCSTSHPDESRRIMEHQRKDFATFLNGENLRLAMDRFSSNLKQLFWPYHATQSNPHSVQIPDLYQFVRDSIFRAQVESLYGKHIFTICPSLCEDFWAFYDAFPIISRGSPRWLYSAQYRSRDRMLDNFDKWRRWCNSNSHRDDEEPGNAESNPIWGTRYVRNMVRRYEGLEFSDAGVSSLLLGFLFVTMANTIPAAAWMILHVFLDQSLCSRLRQELLVGAEGMGSQTDYTALSSAPLLNSVYRETLRLHVAGTIGRKSVGTGVRLHGDSLSSFQFGATGMSANWLGGLDESVWNTGQVINGVAQHPLESFWAERFLEYPDDPTSGPLRKSGLCDAWNISFKGEKCGRDDSKAVLSKPAALRGHFFPFGGGVWRCPGETLAKNTILSSSFLLLRDFDIEFDDPVDTAKVKSRHRAMPFGTHAFERAVPVRMWKRVCK